jgi:hypothetical protein
MLTGVDPPLDGPVVLLEHVVQIWHRPMPTILGQIALAFELRNGGRIRGVAVGVDHPRRGMVRSAQRFGEKALSRGCVLLGREKEIEGGAGGIHRPIQVTPLAFHPDVRLVHAPAVIGGLQVAA